MTTRFRYTKGLPGVDISAHRNLRAEVCFVVDEHEIKLKSCKAPTTKDDYLTCDSLTVVFVLINRMTSVYMCKSCAKNAN